VTLLPRPVLLLVPLAALALAGCSDGPSGHQPRVHEVAIEGSRFLPSTVAVQQGDTVAWHNRDRVAHTATLDSGERDTGTIAAGGKGSFNLPTPGTHRYRCTFHPDMVATIIVTG
jgi:plastocyanin